MPNPAAGHSATTHKEYATVKHTVCSMSQEHSLRSMLTKVKNPLMMVKQAKVVYRILCSCGEVYIGETVRRLDARVKEHRDACQKGALEISALGEHAWKNHHSIKWQEVSVVDRTSTAKELLGKEAIYLHPAESPIPQQGGLELPRCWMAALKSTPSGSNQDLWRQQFQ